MCDRSESAPDLWRLFLVTGVIVSVVTPIALIGFAIPDMTGLSEWGIGFLTGVVGMKVADVLGQILGVVFDV